MQGIDKEYNYNKNKCNRFYNCSLFQVTLVENSPCTLGGTCRGTPDASNNVFVNRNDVIEQPYYDNDLSQNYDAGNDAFYGENDFENNSNSERQTGQDFSSEAPPDCRVTCR